MFHLVSSASAVVIQCSNVYSATGEYRLCCQQQQGIFLFCWVLYGMGTTTREYRRMYYTKSEPLVFVVTFTIHTKYTNELIVCRSTIINILYIYWYIYSVYAVVHSTIERYVAI